MKRALIVLSAAALLLAAASVSGAAALDPGAANTDLILHNPGPDPARLYLTFTSADSGDTAWTSDGGGPLAAHGGRYLLASQFGGEAAGTWQGTVDVGSDRPVVALARTFWDNSATGFRSAAMYPAVGEWGTEAYVARLTVGDGKQNCITLQNGEDREVVATIRFFDRKGKACGTRTLTLRPQSESSLCLDQVPEIDFTATSNCGTAWVSADGRISALTTVLTTNQADAYLSAPSGETALWVPGVNRRLNADGSYNFNAANIQNVGATTATVHAEFIKLDGTVTFAFDDAIAPKGAAAYNTTVQGTLSAATFNALTTSLGTNWQGSLKVTSTNGGSLAGMCFFSAPSAGITDNAIYNVSPTSQATGGALVFPAVYRQVADSANKQWSIVMVANTAGISGTVMVEFYDVEGNPRGGGYTVSIGARGMVRLNLDLGVELPAQALADLGTGFTGSMILRPSEGVSLVGVNYVFWTGKPRLAAYAGFPLP